MPLVNFSSRATFNRNVIRQNWSRINRTPLTKAGLLVRKRARQSIRRGRAGGKPSAPGKPPKSREPGANPPMKLIFSVPNKLGTSVMVGFVGFGSNHPVTEVHEKGLTVTRTLGKGRRRRTVRMRYPKRPTMQPALERSRQELPKLWKDSLR